MGGFFILCLLGSFHGGTQIRIKNKCISSLLHNLLNSGLKPFIRSLLHFTTWPLILIQAVSIFYKLAALENLLNWNSNDKSE